MTRSRPFQALDRSLQVQQEQAAAAANKRAALDALMERRGWIKGESGQWRPPPGPEADKLEQALGESLW